MIFGKGGVHHPPGINESAHLCIYRNSIPSFLQQHDRPLESTFAIVHIQIVLEPRTPKQISRMREGTL